MSNFINDIVPASPDDVCGVCATRREDHGDKHHQFNLTDQLVPIKPGPKPEKQAPRHRDDPPPPDLHMPFATLLEVLAEKGIVNAKDIIRIFGGQG